MLSRIRTISLLLAFIAGKTAGQPPAGYYVTAEGKAGTELRQALHEIIKGHTESTYSALWAHFMTTDARSDGKVWDMYSDIPGGTPPYLYTFTTDQCGNYSKEGDCYNREHSFPVSWWGGSTTLPMYTDLFHIYPTDGHVNGRRANYAYGVVASASWTSQNGSKLGSNSWPGFSGTVFEPIDAYKGDFARSMLYMATRYYAEDAAWPSSSDMFTGADPKSWVVSMLLHWHNTDPVSQKEVDRNNAVYGIQSNRNPFIDKPEYAVAIWGDPTSVSESESTVPRPVLYPVPAREKVTISFPEYQPGETVMRLMNLAGNEIMVTVIHNADRLEIDLSSLDPGIYLLTLKTGTHRFGYLLPVIK